MALVSPAAQLLRCVLASSAGGVVAALRGQAARGFAAAAAAAASPAVDDVPMPVTRAGETVWTWTPAETRRLRELMTVGGTSFSDLERRRAFPLPHPPGARRSAASLKCKWARLRREGGDAAVAAATAAASDVAATTNRPNDVEATTAPSRRLRVEASHSAPPDSVAAAATTMTATPTPSLPRRLRFGCVDGWAWTPGEDALLTRLMREGALSFVDMERQRLFPLPAAASLASVPTKMTAAASGATAEASVPASLASPSAAAAAATTAAPPPHGAWRTARMIMKHWIALTNRRQKAARRHGGSGGGGGDAAAGDTGMGATTAAKVPPSQALLSVGGAGPSQLPQQLRPGVWTWTPEEDARLLALKKTPPVSAVDTSGGVTAAAGSTSTDAPTYAALAAHFPLPGGGAGGSGTRSPNSLAKRYALLLARRPAA